MHIQHPEIPRQALCFGSAGEPRTATASEATCVFCRRLRQIATNPLPSAPFSAEERAQPCESCRLPTLEQLARADTLLEAYAFLRRLNGVFTVLVSRVDTDLFMAQIDVARAASELLGACPCCAADPDAERTLEVFYERALRALT